MKKIYPAAAREGTSLSTSGIFFTDVVFLAPALSDPLAFAAAHVFCFVDTLAWDTSYFKGSYSRSPTEATVLMAMTEGTWFIVFISK